MRYATLKDTPNILNILCAMHREARVSVFDLDLNKLTNFLHWLITEPSGIALVDGEPICGVVLGVVQEMWFGKDKEAFNLPLYVLAEHRGGPYATRLVEGYKKRAIELGAHPAAVTWVNNSGIAVEQTNRFISRMGFLPVGEYFVATQ